MLFLVVEPSKIIFPIQDTIPQKEDRMLLYIRYHNIPKYNTTHIGACKGSFKLERFEAWKDAQAATRCRV